MKNAKTILEANQETIDRIIKENETIASNCNMLKKQINQINHEISNKKTQAIESMKPKIKELALKQRHEIEKLKKSQKIELDELINSHNEQIKNIQEELSNNIQKANKESRDKINKMEDILQKRQIELQRKINEKISQVTSKIEKAKEKSLQEEEVFRTQWEKIIINKLQKEFQSNLTEKQKTLKEKQLEEVTKTISELETKTITERRDLETKIQSEEKEHLIIITNLQQKLKVLKEEFDSCEPIDESEINELREQLNNCKCVEYRKQIKKLNEEIKENENEINNIKNLNLIQQNKTQLKINELNESINENKIKQNKLKEEINELQIEIVNITKQHQKNVLEIKDKFNQEISDISGRIKQTIGKKDEIIKKLTLQLRQLGINVD